MKSDGGRTGRLRNQDTRKMKVWFGQGAENSLLWGVQGHQL